jgi:hypothetical protein
MKVHNGEKSWATISMSTITQKSFL